MTDTFEIYKDYMEHANKFDDLYLKYFHRIPKSRYHTFKYCADEFEKNNGKIIVELGTSRSFVDGKFEGCNVDDASYWEPENPEKWDWSAGYFTKLFSSRLPNANIDTVDISPSHINRCYIMNNEKTNITYNICSSEYFLENFNKKIDLLYLDTGDMTPIENTALLHLREADIIIKRDLLSENGIILIDDVRSVVPKQFGEHNDLGKAKYSIPYFCHNGYEIVMDEYQTVLRRKS